MKDAGLLSDLAAAYYVRGTAENRVEVILSAIDASSRARMVDPTLAAASFQSCTGR